VNIRHSLSFQIFLLVAALLILSFITIIIFRARFKVKRLLPEYATVGHVINYKMLIRNLDNRLQQDLFLIDELKTPFLAYQEYSDFKKFGDKKRNWFNRKIGYPGLMNLIQKKHGAYTGLTMIKEIPGKDEFEVNL